MIRDPRHPLQFIEDWWTPARQLFTQKDLIHTLRHYNKRTIPHEGMRVVRHELLPNGGLDYSDAHENYRFIQAMSRYSYH